MTVRELVDLLKAFPPDARVLVDGYESGYDDPQQPRPVTACESGYGAASVMGEYEDADAEPWAAKPSFTAILIPR